MVVGAALYWIIVSTPLLPFLLFQLVKLLYAIFQRIQERKKYPQLIANRKKVCDDSFNFEVKGDELNENIRGKILASDVIGLRKMIWDKEVTSVQVLRFYFYRAKTIGRELGAAIEANFQNSLQLAIKADILISSKPQNELPVLCGVPFSVKESFLMEGFEITHGLEARIGKKIIERNCSLIDYLIAQGAIPFVRSNIPQLVMCSETVNPVYGRCVNAHNKDRVSGGSSGGEGTLIGSGCSPVGLGNDIGGSVRIPALYNGIYGFLPTTGRQAAAHHLEKIHINFEEDKVQTFIKVCNGPLGKSVSDLILFTRLMSHPSINEDVDPLLPPVVWRDEATVMPKSSKLVIGYYKSLYEVFNASPANQRAVEMVVDALKKAGHELISIEVPEIREIFNLTVRILLSDASVPDHFSISSGINVIKPYQVMQILLLIPRSIKTAISFLLRFLGLRRISDSIMSTNRFSEEEFFPSEVEHLNLSSKFINRLKKQGITHLISPGLGTPAPLHDTTGDIIPNYVYTSMFNFIGLPTGVIPVTKVNKDEQIYKSNISDMITKKAQEIMQNTEGLPIGVQVSALPFKDEECLALMKHIEEIMDLKPFIKH